MFSSLERKHYIILACAFAGVFLGASIIAFGIAPRIANHKITTALAKAGFDTKYIKPSRNAYGAMLYTDVAFDADAFSTVKYIKVTYNPFLMPITGAFHELDIIEMNVMGNWSTDAFNSLSFAGWKPQADLSKIPLTSFKRINIARSRISLLTQEAGGLSIFFDGTGNRSGSKIEFQGNIKSEQKFLSLITNASGVIEGPRWYSDIEIVDGKFEEPSGDFKATRMSGWMNIANPVTEPFKIMSQLRAGGLTLYGLPWQAASSTIDYSNNNLRFFTEAKSVGYDGIELELNILKIDQAPLSAGGTIHADKPAVFFDYFAGHKGFEGLLKHLTPLKEHPGVHADFVITGDRQARYEVKKDGETSGAKGQVTFKKPISTP